jgi:signal transduction histidine kinase
MSLLSEDVLQTLAPADLTLERDERYAGGGMSVPLVAFQPEDRETLRRLYTRLTAFRDDLEAAGADTDDSEVAVQVVERFLEEYGWRPLMSWAKSLGDPVEGAVDPETFRQVRHDIRGGALVSALQLAERGRLDDKRARKMYMRVRDHAKIVRNAVPELDPETHEEDSREHLHGASLIVDKWQDTELANASGESVDVRVEATYEGSVSQRCVEFAALDRVVYNLMNNAVEGTTDGTIELYLAGVPTSAPEHLRIAVANPVDEAFADDLREEFGGDDVSGLFRGGYTTGGSGVGLRICTEFIGHAYGVTPRAAVDEGHVGARLRDDTFVNWVHWPALA